MLPNATAASAAALAIALAPSPAAAALVLLMATATSLSAAASAAATTTAATAATAAAATAATTARAGRSGVVGREEGGDDVLAGDGWVAARPGCENAVLVLDGGVGAERCRACVGRNEEVGVAGAGPDRAEPEARAILLNAINQRPPLARVVGHGHLLRLQGASERRRYHGTSERRRRWCAQR